MCERMWLWVPEGTRWRGRVALYGRNVMSFSVRDLIGNAVLFSVGDVATACTAKLILRED